MTPTRRQILRTSAAAAAALSLGPAARAAASCTTRGATSLLFDISLAEWSLHRALKGGEMTNLDFPARASKEFGIRAVEYVSQFFMDKARDEAYLSELHRRCADLGVKSLLIMGDGEGELAAADSSAREKAVESHQKWIDAAARLACHSIRVNAAGEGRRDEVAKRAADSLRALAEYAAPHRLSVIVENHGGLSSDGGWLAGVMKLADHPGVGTLPDFGNFDLGGGKQYDRYEGVEELLPWAKAVSAKSHDFDEQGECVETDFLRMLGLVVDAGYQGYVGIEYEGEQRSEPEGIRLTQALLERVRSQLD